MTHCDVMRRLLARPGTRIAELLGSASQIRWFQGVLPDHHYRRGDTSFPSRLGAAGQFRSPASSSTH